MGTSTPSSPPSSQPESPADDKFCRVIHFPARGQAGWLTEPMPQPNRGQILIRTTHSGISNGTERSFLVGGPYGGSRWPCRCGYQTVGMIQAVGADVVGYRAGDRVFCGRFGHHASHILADVAQAQGPGHLTVILPDTVEAEHAALLGVASVSMRDSRLCGVRIGTRVLVVGAGLIGQFAAQACRVAGAEVTVASRTRPRLDTALACGADEVVEVPDAPSWSALRGRGFDVCIETSGADILEAVMGRSPGDPGVLRYEGSLFLSGGRHEVRYDSLAAQSQALRVLHATHFRREDLLQTLRLVSAGTIRVEPLVTRIAPVSDMEALYADLRDRPESLLGTVLHWRP